MATRTSSDADSAWYDDDQELLNAVSTFHDFYSMSPEKLRVVKELVENMVLKKFSEYLGFCTEAIEIGGSYEGVKVVKSEKDDDFEFDVMFVLKIPEIDMEIVEIPERRGYAVLKVANARRDTPDYHRLTNHKFLAKCLTFENDMCIVDAGKTTSAFLNELREWIKPKPIPEYKLLPKQHGTAIQIDVIREHIGENRNQIFYSVDIAPTFQIVKEGDVMRYVTKPEKKRTPDSVTWRRLFDSEETDSDQEQHDRNILRAATDELHEQLSESQGTCVIIIQARRTRLPVPEDVIEKLQAALVEQASNYRLTSVNLKDLKKSTDMRLIAITYPFDKELEALPVPEKPGYAWLKLREAASVSSRLRGALKLCYLPGGKYLDIKAASDMLVKELQDIANDLFRDQDVIVHRDGPIVRMYVYPEKDNTLLYYCLDIVLSACVDDNFYIGLPHDYDDIPDKKAWRRSRSYEETKKIQVAPKGLKMVFRVLKALRNSEPGLAQLTSYHFKTHLLNIEKLKTVDWNENVAQILIRVLKYLKVCLNEKKLLTYFIPEINLFENMTNDCSFHMEKRIANLLESKEKLIAVLKIPSKETDDDFTQLQKNESAQVFLESRSVSGFLWQLLYRSFTKSTDKYIQNASEALRKAMAINDQFMAEIQQHLKRRGICDHVKKAGNTYDGLNVDEDDNIQLETLMIQPVNRFDIAVEKEGDMPGYVWLRYNNERAPCPLFDRVLNHYSIFIYRRYLDVEKTVVLFERELQKCIAESKQMNGKVKLNRIGLILQMEVYPESWLFSWGSRLYTVNIVPAYKVGEELYESRPIKGDVMPDDTMIWHRSFVLKERQMLSEGAKMVLRVLKVLCKRESDFGNFTSYQLKTAVLHETDANQDWSEPKLERRLAGVLARLEKCLAARKLPHYFSPEINLLSKMPSYTMDFLRDRIQLLRANESEMRKLLQRIGY